jgi:hypothetical protein
MGFAIFSVEAGRLRCAGCDGVRRFVREDDASVTAMAVAAAVAAVTAASRKAARRRRRNAA